MKILCKIIYCSAVSSLCLSHRLIIIHKKQLKKIIERSFVDAFMKENKSIPVTGNSDREVFGASRLRHF
jgi:hypothetical protein